MAARNLFLLALYVMACAWARESCDDDHDDQPDESSLLQTFSAKETMVTEHVANGSLGQKKFSTSSEYCYESNSLRGQCWANKPASSTAECNTATGTTNGICKCPSGSDAGCDVPVDLATGVSGRCSNIITYIPNATDESNDGKIGISGNGANMEKFCREMVMNDQWRQNGLIAPSDEPENRGKEWCWLALRCCPDGYESADHVLTTLFRDGKCHRKKRYLYEECWGEFGSAGKCAGSDSSYGEYSTACYGGSCVPYAEAENRKQCECSWTGLNLFVVCGAADDMCDGHACVWNTGNGNRYCDYATGQGWNSLLD